MTSSAVQHHYGPQCQQPDLPREELLTLCQEYFDREVAITEEKAASITVNTQLLTLCQEYFNCEVAITEEKAASITVNTLCQADCNLWYYHRRIRLTTSNFGKVAKRQKTTPVANLVKSLLYSKTRNTKELRWGCTHEVDAQNAYWQYLKDQSGCQDAEITNTGLIIDTKSPCLACSPDTLVNIPGAQEPLGIAECNCPYSLAHSNPPQTAVEAARNNKKFYCQLSSSGGIELKTGRDYYFQVQGTLSITRRK